MYKNKYQKNNFQKVKKPQILPPVSVLEQYESLVPGSAERIIDMADLEQEHRHNWENRALTAYIISYRIGQILGLIGMLGVFIMAIYSALYAKDIDLAYLIVVAGIGFYSFIAAISIGRKRFYERPFKKKVKY